MVPIVISWKHFPERKGLITGVILGCYGFGSFIYSQISRAICNPDDLAATLETDTKELKLFNDEVASRVPNMMRVLSLLFLVQVLLASALVRNPATTGND